MTHELNDLTHALVRAATNAYQAAHQEYRDREPDSHSAMAALVKHGAPMHVAVTLTPAPKVELGILHAERFEVFFTWPAQPAALN
jgi:hypothetical protein